jgi:hypothetical protein
MNEAVVGIINKAVEDIIERMEQAARAAELTTGAPPMHVVRSVGVFVAAASCHMTTKSDTEALHAAGDFVRVFCEHMAQTIESARRKS